MGYLLSTGVRDREARKQMPALTGDDRMMEKSENPGEWKGKDGINSGHISVR